MKGIYLGAVAVLFICMVLFPLLSMKETVLPTNPSETQSNSSTIENSVTFRIKNTETDKITKMSAKEYCIGVVSAEMAAEYEPEALKAQAVVAYTYALYKAENRKDKEYDLTDSHLSDQAFLYPDKAKERFKENYEKYTEKITSAVNSVLGEYVAYKGKPILATCHSISGGKTESGETVWGGTYPYLKPVESAGDVLSPGYLSEVSITAEQMKSALSNLKITVKGDPESWLTDFNRSASGYTTTLKACGTEITGSELRAALDLRSSNFDVEIKDEVFKFSVRGYGHGVGLSQYGAQYMALQGSKYDEILMWYYTDCSLQKAE